MHAQADTLISDQTVQPLDTREALAIELDTTVHERGFEYHEAMMLKCEREIGALPLSLVPDEDDRSCEEWLNLQAGLDCCLSYTKSCLNNAASSAMSRFGIWLEFNHWEGIRVVGTWLELLRRPMLVHPVEATARHQRT